jgi:ring-1,2-phenylacetyl-CoA epoxidase subunit PaaC
MAKAESNMEIKPAIVKFLLRLGDDTLILGHRLGEWCGHGPILEQDIALTNISLDLIGQCRSYLTVAGNEEGKGRDENDLAYKRIEREFFNHLLVEQPNGDFGKTIVRQFLFDAYHITLLDILKASNHSDIAAIAEKSLKEVTYHYRFSSEWLIRLGDGTQESHQRVQNALNELWSYTGELFETDEVEKTLVDHGLIPSLDGIKERWLKLVKEVIAESTLTTPPDQWMQRGGRNGVHSEHLGYLLSEMQYLPRVYPDAKW